MFIVIRFGAQIVRGAIIASTVFALVAGSARADTLIAVVGDSNVNGKGVSRDQAYPAKLERALKAKGYEVSVLSSGLNGDTSAGLLRRLNSAAPPDTKVAVVWIGINDIKNGVQRDKVRANNQEISGRLKKRGIAVVMIRTPDHADLFQKYLIPGDAEKHITPAGYDVLVSRTIGEVESAIKSVKK
jgi:lysophospholipase L1-like esterase